MRNDKVTVVFAADSGYARPLTVAARSVIDTVDQGVRLELCVLDMGIEPSDRALMEASFEHPAVELVWVDKLQDRVAQFPNTWPIITRATYARIYIPEVLPDTERALYLDCDVMARQSVSDLHSCDMGDAWAMGSPDVQAPFVPFGVPNWYEAGRSAGDLNFNAGVLLMDLEAWRTHGLTEELLRYLTDGRHLRAQDQEAINAVLAGRIGEMDPRWNQQAEIFWEGIQYHYEAFLPYRDAVLEDVRVDPWIVHFSSQPKPWHWGCDHPFLDEWFRNLDRTAYRGWRPPAPSKSQLLARKWGKRVADEARRLAHRL
jgi:lipopolysaccharide biosynthesis glycosyltransferase